MTDSEIERRLPVWHAMSDLFLDTKIGPPDHGRIAEILRRSGFELAELETIFETEVAPAFAANLMSLAGEWAGWSENEVRAIVLRSLREGPCPTRWLALRLRGSDARQEWQKVAELL